MWVVAEELYDLESDPGQHQNVLEDHPAVAAELREELERWSEWVRIGATPTERKSLAEALAERVLFGPEALVDLARIPGATIVNGIVGVAGLSSSVAALEAGNRLALANKESLVAGGDVVLTAGSRGGGTLVPVDSEHSAIHQCLVGEQTDSVRRLILSASGGPFRGRTSAELETVTVDEALAHPTWNMGPRITIDSATLMNKAFEVIEAHYLFGIDYDRIDTILDNKPSLPTQF